MTDYQVVASTMRRVVGEQYTTANALYTRVLEVSALYYPQHEFKSDTRSIDCAIQRLRPSCDRYDLGYAQTVGYVLTHTVDGNWVVVHYPVVG